MRLREVRLINYYYYRKLGCTKAWEMAGMEVVAEKAKNIVLLLAMICCITFLLSEKANAISEEADSRVMAKVKNQAEYIKGLEKIVAACLSDSHGKPLAIGDEWFLCGIVPIGSFKK